MTERQTTSPQRRLQALRAIPDSRRTEEQWDELNELEIMLAPVNRVAPFGGHADGNRPRRVPGAAANGANPPSARPPKTTDATGNLRRKSTKRPRKRQPGAETPSPPRIDTE